MFETKRPARRPAVLFFFLASVVLAACGTAVANNNWPGLTANGEEVYVAYGPGIVAVDVKEQKELWSFPAEPQPRVQFYAAPSVVDGQLVVGDYGASGGFFSPGVRVTIYGLTERQSEAPTTDWASDTLAKDRIVAPPLQIGDIVFVGTADNFVLALDAESGTPLWNEPFEAEHSIWAQPSYDNGKLYVASLDKKVYALNADSGQELWRAELGGAAASKPIVGSELVYVSSFDRDLHALDKESGLEKWSAPAEDWVWAAPALDGDQVYYVDIQGNVFAVDAATGRQIWTMNVGGVVRATPVVADGVVYVATAGDSEVPVDERQGALVALSGDGGTILWQKAVSAPVLATPVLAGDAIVIARQESENPLRLDVFDREDGDQLWSFPPTVQ